MWLESEVAVGSTFGFTLPAHAGAISGPGGGVDVPQAVGEVVVIEDDRPSLDLLNAYLSGAALKVTTAVDGQSGLEAVRRLLPAAVLLDIRLPGIDGWSVLRALKADPQTRGIPVIVVSMVDERARGIALGAAAYLVKPVGRDDLLAALVAAGVLVSSREQREGIEVETS
jgi:CheY-like chemotaxis protein